jgi:hypothetical protein
MLAALELSVIVKKCLVIIKKQCRHQLTICGITPHFYPRNSSIVAIFDPRVSPLPTAHWDGSPTDRAQVWPIRGWNRPLGRSAIGEPLETAGAQIPLTETRSRSGRSAPLCP